MELTIDELRLIREALRILEVQSSLTDIVAYDARILSDKISAELCKRFGIDAKK